MLGGLAILFVFLAIGDALSALAKIPIPGSVIGMVLLAVSLKAGIVKLEAVQGAAEALTDNLSLLFVPAGAGLILYFDLIGRSWLPLLTAYLVSTFLVLAAVGLLQQRLDKAWKSS